MQGIGGDYLTDERMVHMRTSHLYGEIGSQFSGTARECKDSFCFADEDVDFPPTVYPSGAVLLRPFCLNDHNLFGLGRLAPVFINTDGFNMSMLYSAKPYGSLIR